MTTATEIRYTVETADEFGAIIKDNQDGGYVTDDSGICEWPNREIAQNVADEMNEAA